LGAKTVGFVGASLARRMYGFDTGRSRGLLGFFHGGKRNGRWEDGRRGIVKQYSMLSLDIEELHGDDDYDIWEKIKFSLETEIRTEYLNLVFISFKPVVHCG